MALSDTDTIDLISKPLPGDSCKLIFFIIDSAVPTDEHQRYQLLVRKLTSYLAYALSDDFRREHPGIEGSNVMVRVLCKTPPNEAMVGIQVIGPNGGGEPRIAVKFGGYDQYMSDLVKEMPAVTEEMPIQRFQFALRDLLLIVVACAVWTAIIPPFWVPKSFDIQFSSTFWYPPWACVTTLVVVLLSGASSLILTASSRIDATTRSGWLALFLVLVPLLFCIVIALLMHRMHVHTAAEKAHLRLGGLASGQERYRLDHGEYSPSLGNLDPYVPSMERPFSSAEGLPGQPGVRPIDSYVFRILKAQGSHAPGGRKSYIKTDKDGKKWLTEGFAIIAIPASGEKGIILMVACCGDLICLFGKALGPDAAQIASQITEFDPDESWIEVKR